MNNYAISTDELASALQRSAATLKVAGNNIYEAAALVTAGKLYCLNIWRHIL